MYSIMTLTSMFSSASTLYTLLEAQRATVSNDNNTRTLWKFEHSRLPWKLMCILGRLLRNSWAHHKLLIRLHIKYVLICSQRVLQTWIFQWKFGHHSLNLTGWEKLKILIFISINIHRMSTMCHSLMCWGFKSQWRRQQS